MKRGDPELDYYREVEDCFAALRGTPHVLSPRDFQLLRGWWRDEIPMAAVVAGLTEVFARRRERDDGDPVTSLSYCRHAVKRHAKRLSEMHVGGAKDARDSGAAADVPTVVELVRSLEAAADAVQRSEVAAILRRVAAQVDRAGRELPPTLLDEHLFSLESAMLAECWRALPETERADIERRIGRTVEATTTDPEARRRSVRAMRDRETRIVLGLPRLELDP